jgi:hypothetical protein
MDQWRQLTDPAAFSEWISGTGKWISSTSEWISSTSEQIQVAPVNGSARHWAGV